MSNKLPKNIMYVDDEFIIRKKIISNIIYSNISNDEKIFLFNSFILRGLKTAITYFNEASIEKKISNIILSNMDNESKIIFLLIITPKSIYELLKRDEDYKICCDKQYNDRINEPAKPKKIRVKKVYETFRCVCGELFNDKTKLGHSIKSKCHKLYLKEKFPDLVVTLKYLIENQNNIKKYVKY